MIWNWSIYSKNPLFITFYCNKVWKVNHSEDKVKIGMSFMDFSRIGSARADRTRNEKFDIRSYDIRDKSELYNFRSQSDLTPIKPSGTPNAKALKWVGLSIGVIVSFALVVILIVCLVVFLKNGNYDKDNLKTTLPYQKEKYSSTPPPSAKILSSTATESVAATTALTTSATGETSASTNVSTTTEASATTPTVSTIETASATATTGSENHQTSTIASFTTAIANGIWSNWGPWTLCAVTCGNSSHSRYRTCIKNSANDRNCAGDFKEQKECSTFPCQVYGIWTTWESWSNCNVTCGGGTQIRSRSCVKIINTDIDCVGRSSQMQTCNNWTCPDCSKVCTIGSLNSECDACECSMYVQGLVTNQNGGLLKNVSVSHISAPQRELTRTNENGTFNLNNVCNQNDIILKKTGYQDTTLTISATSVSAVMQLIKYPVITTQPKSHLRLQGESVEFCCKATENPVITSYEWLKNGNLLNESFHPNGTTLTLTDLQFADSGSVVCRANSQIGAVFSDFVTLSVRENPDDFCSDALGPYEINLPSDCVQADSNSVKYNIGTCSPKSCRKNISNVEQSCSVDKKFCCTPSGRDKRIIQCNGYSFPLYVTTSCTCDECEDIDITLEGQAVGATSGLPLRFGRIDIDGKSVGTTGVVGDFSLTIPRGTTRIAVLFKDVFFNQFLDTLKIIRFKEELLGSFYVHVSMIEKTSPINIYSNESNTLQLAEQDGAESIASLTIPPNSIFYPNGTRYNGIVKASLNIFDSRNSSSIQNAPGEFVSVDDEGQTQNLQSFGVFSLSLQDQSGSSLQIAGETEIRLDRTFFESTSIGNITDAKLWGLNPETGVWEDQDTLRVLSSRRRKRQSIFLVGAIQISAYSWWNIDVLYSWRPCYFRPQAFEGDNKITNFIVRLIYLNSGSVVGFRDDYISNDETVMAICRIGEPLAGYIQVEKTRKMFPVDKDSSGLTSDAKSLINYQVIEDDKTVSADVRISNTGPFYDSDYATFDNIFRFKLSSNEYLFKVLNPNMQEAISNNYPGDQVWYPPLNSFLINEVQFRTCVIKIGTINANSNLSFRVVSKINETTIIGIHEKGLTNGATCIEYRCSVQNPDFDITKGIGNDFYRYPKTYTLIQIEPLGQFCTVSGESTLLRTHEQTNMGWSSPESNLGDTFFKVNIPDNEYEGIFFHKSDSFDGIPNAMNSAIKECNKGVHSSFSASEEDMTPTVGLATTFTCL